MIAHIVTYTFLPGADPGIREELHEALTRMRAQLGDTIVSYHHGPALNLSPGGADYGVVSIVRDETALHEYLDSSVHRAIGTEFAERLFATRQAVQIDVLAGGDAV